ncbi:hypothetical protein [Paenibacillus chibensis]|uniref:hypothetical protein n=1 Tax=Paenibacillus chibensis TaxID=59846 RepID=UPI000FD71ED6|nr:hypothetical protein [Paenibacillus chibensis]MEC0370861.1 hypothetical protein [Paenibacillus chibensis]
MRKLWLNKVQAKASGIPCLIPKQVEIDGEWVMEGRWTSPPPTADILLPYNRCKQVGCPVQERERPAAYVYNASEKTQFRYIPFWARFSEDIDHSKITDDEAWILSLNRGGSVRKFKSS